MSAIKKEIHQFIGWLLTMKERRGENLTDKDYYAVGLYAFYLSDMEDQRKE